MFFLKPATLNIGRLPWNSVKPFIFLISDLRVDVTGACRLRQNRWHLQRILRIVGTRKTKVSDVNRHLCRHPTLIKTTQPFAKLRLLQRLLFNALLITVLSCRLSRISQITLPLIWRCLKWISNTVEIFNGIHAACATRRVSYVAGHTRNFDAAEIISSSSWAYF